MSGSPMYSPQSSVKRPRGRKGWIWLVAAFAVLLLLAILVIWGIRNFLQGRAPKETQPPGALADIPEVKQVEEASATPTPTPTLAPTSTPTATPAPSLTPNLRRGSTVDRNTNQPLDDPAADVLDVQVKCTQQKAQVCAAFAGPFPP